MHLLTKAGRLVYNVKKSNKCWSSSALRLYANGPCNSWPEWKMPEGHDTGISVYNRAIKQKVPLVTQNPGLLTWYMCGPTVYDSPHIGHALCYMRFDIIRRILVDHFNLNVIQVMGITDIDDKIVHKANYFKVDFMEISRHFEAEFLRDMATLGIQPPTLYTRVTEHIDDVTGFIQAILDQGLAYRVADGSVFFNNIAYRKSRGLNVPEEFDERGDSAKLDTTSDEHEWLTDEPSLHKHHPIDFALWKSSKKDEPTWPSKFGEGRPGWHIECSAMASSIFGDTLDVHSGGIDLQFPHHYCEEAQSCARYSANMWTNYWWHSGHLSIDSKKMSKSLGNVISIQQLLSTYSTNTFRHFVLTSHYTRLVSYHDDTLAQAATQVNKLQAFFDDCHHFLQTNRRPCSPHSLATHPLIEELQRTKERIDECLRDDFSTVNAIRAVMHLVGVTNGYLFPSDTPAVNKAANRAADNASLLSSGAAVNVATDKAQERYVGASLLNSRPFDTLDADKDISEMSNTKVHKDDVKATSDSTNLSNYRAANKNSSAVVGRYEVAAVRNYVLDLMKMFGMNYNARQVASMSTSESQNSNSDLDQRFPDVMKALLDFRLKVRNHALLKDMSKEKLAGLSKSDKQLQRLERAALLKACDALRDSLAASSILVKDQKDGTSWALNEDPLKKSPDSMTTSEPASKATSKPDSKATSTAKVSQGKEVNINKKIQTPS